MIIKKDGRKQGFDPQKIINAIKKSADRCCIVLTEEENDTVVNLVKQRVDQASEDVSVAEIHNMVECALDQVNPAVANSYREYRNYKKDFSVILNKK